MSTNCENCPVHNAGQLKKLGVNMENWNYVVALAGNPNTGKSTVFNELTGLHQHTGNWPGKTVVRAEGGFKYEDAQFKIVDLPGTYSLLSTSADEEVARNFILFGQPDVTVVVVDATRLERNLNLTLQVLEITNRAVLCLNLIDEAERNNIHIDSRRLSKELGIPVVPTAARQHRGIDKLLQMINEVATGKFMCKPHRIKNKSRKINNAVSTIETQLNKRFPGIRNTRWLALRLLEGDPRIEEAIRTNEINFLIKSQDENLLNVG